MKTKASRNSKKFSNGKTLKAAYNRRIQRPSIQYLNPNIQASNPIFMPLLVFFTNNHTQIPH
ncbi:MAG TPA: outer membrane beta-barrel protein [Ohtaekwangia sp.]|uniref:outer membrane beta-barrel protein n=1 Tax=Ohtaekwangia sp. TaxID=2066019 RepID=UPI002F95E3D3